jgi:hypothetical protein
MNLQENIRKILKEETSDKMFIRRRLHELDDLLMELLKTAYSPHKICVYRNSEQFIEHLIYTIINEHIYYDYYQHIDDTSKEWESLYRTMEEYLRIKYENKLDEYYHMNCGD